MSWLYKKSKKNKDRYVIGEIFRSDILFCIGINPNNGNPKKLEATTTKIKNVARLNGYANWIMFNLCSQRTSTPSQLANIINQHACKKNISTIIEHIEKYKSNNEIYILVAFGDILNEKPYIKDNLIKIYHEIINLNISVKWYAISVNENGSPQHPSRATLGEFIEFDMDEYIQNLMQ